jgi:hypothetical protein
MSAALWMIAYDRIYEDLTSDDIDVEEARDRLRRLGFDTAEIEDHIDVWQERK